MGCIMMILANFLVQDSENLQSIIRDDTAPKSSRRTLLKTMNEYSRDGPSCLRSLESTAQRLEEADNKAKVEEEDQLASADTRPHRRYFNGGIDQMKIEGDQWSPPDTTDQSRISHEFVRRQIPEEVNRSKETRAQYENSRRSQRRSFSSERYRQDDRYRSNGLRHQSSRRKRSRDRSPRPECSPDRPPRHEGRDRQRPCSQDRRSRSPDYQNRISGGYDAHTPLQRSTKEYLTGPQQPRLLPSQAGHHPHVSAASNRIFSRKYTAGLNFSAWLPRLVGPRRIMRRYLLPASSQLHLADQNQTLSWMIAHQICEFDMNRHRDRNCPGGDRCQKQRLCQVGRVLFAPPPIILIRSQAVHGYRSEGQEWQCNNIACPHVHGIRPTCRHLFTGGCPHGDACRMGHDLIDARRISRDSLIHHKSSFRAHADESGSENRRR